MNFERRLKMRFKCYNNGDIRIKKKFLFFPKTLRNKIIWLEIVFIVQEHERCSNNYSGFWKDIKFVDKNEIYDHNCVILD